MRDGDQNIVAGYFFRKGDLAFFRIKLSRLISAPRPYSRTVLRCAVLGCKAECEFRGFAQKEESKDALKRPGVLLARPAKKPDAEFLNGKSYVISGQFQEHYHVTDASVRKVPHTVKRKLEHFINSQPQIQVNKLSAETLIDQSFAGLEQVKSLLSRSALVLASGELLKKPRLELATSSLQTTSADAEAISEVPATVLQQPLPDSATHDSQSIENRLIRVGLIYVPEFSVFYCAMCKCYLRDKFAAHSQRLHKVKIPVNLLKEIKESLPISNRPIPENDSSEAIDPFPHLPVKSGFACSSCSFCLSNRKHIRAHIVKKHRKNVATAIACFVQCPFSGPAHKLVRVKSRAESIPDGINPVISQQEIEEFCDKCIRELENDQHEWERAKEKNARNPLYEELVWFKKSELEYLLTKDLTIYFRGVFENEKIVHNIMFEIVSSVRQADFVVRYLMDKNAKGMQYDLDEKTVLKYADTATQFINFVARMSLHPMSRYSMFPVDNMAELIRRPTKALIIKILLECAFQEGAGNIKQCFLSTFLRLGSFKEDGSLASAHSLADSDLIYLIKAAVICQHLDSYANNEGSLLMVNLMALRPNLNKPPNSFVLCTVILKIANDMGRKKPYECLYNSE